VQEPPSGPRQPALQVQLLKAVLCSGEPESGGQLLQLSAPDMPLYLPATHAAHGPPVPPVYPALQAQSVIAVLAPGESE
jgi:hypothetical protein